MSINYLSLILQESDHLNRPPMTALDEFYELCIWEGQLRKAISEKERQIADDRQNLAEARAEFDPSDVILICTERSCDFRIKIALHERAILQLALDNFVTRRIGEITPELLGSQPA